MKIRVILRVIVCGLLLALLVPAAKVEAAKPSKTARQNWRARFVNRIVVLPWQKHRCALRIAAEDLENIRPQYRPARFRFLVRDTQLDPEKALDAIRDLDQRGVRIVIGPQSSAEVAKIKSYADAHNILVISQGSTASSLAPRR